jgi:hypothetical protein
LLACDPAQRTGRGSAFLAVLDGHALKTQRVPIGLIALLAAAGVISHLERYPLVFLSLTRGFPSTSAERPSKHRYQGVCRQNP